MNFHAFRAVLRTTSLGFRSRGLVTSAHAAGKGSSLVKHGAVYSVRVLDCGAGIELMRDDGHESITRRLHPLWLRERTQDPRFLHVESAQRLFECADLAGSDGARVAEAVVHGNELKAKFCDGVCDTFNLEELAHELENRWVMSTRTKFTGGADGARIPVDLAFPKMKYWGGDLDGKFELSQV
jgi:hypothetical protein